MPSEMRSFSTSTSSTTALTISPLRCRLSASSPDTPQAMSDMWTMPSTSPSRPMNRPNSVAFLTSPSTSVPTGCLSAKAAHGLACACLRPSEMRRFSSSTSSTDDVDFLRGRDDLARMDVLLGPAHLGDVDQALDARLQLDEGAIFGDVGDAALEHAADRIFGGGAFPRIALELLHAEADALGVAVDADDLHLHRVADVDHLATGGRRACS